MKIAPVVLFVHKRLLKTKNCIESLQKNILADQSRLYIFSDGPSESLEVRRVREFLKSIKGFKEVIIYESETNLGLAQSVIKGVTRLFENNDSLIIIEDDLLFSTNFLLFMNNGLNHYQNDQKVLNISGYTQSFITSRKKPLSSDYYFSIRSSSWGWATWKDRWEVVDWSPNSVNFSLFNYLNLLRGGPDLPRMARKQRISIIDSWAVRWAQHQLNNNYLTLHPYISKVRNDGFDSTATHTKAKLIADPLIDTYDKSEFRPTKNPKLNYIFWLENWLSNSRLARMLKRLS